MNTDTKTICREDEFSVVQILTMPALRRENEFMRMNEVLHPAFNKKAAPCNEEEIPDVGYNYYSVRDEDNKPVMTILCADTNAYMYLYAPEAKLIEDRLDPLLCEHWDLISKFRANETEGALIVSIEKGKEINPRERFSRANHPAPHP